jgi:hypothetical protein
MLANVSNSTGSRLWLIDTGALFPGHVSVFILQILSKPSYLFQFQLQNENIVYNYGFNALSKSDNYESTNSRFIKFMNFI